MEQTVLSTLALKSLFGKRVIGVKIDSDDNRHLVDRFNVQSLPSDILLTPTGTIITRTDGMQNKTSISVSWAEVLPAMKMTDGSIWLKKANRN